MRVTNVRLKLADSADLERGLLAYASVEIDGCFIFHDAKLLNSGSKRPDGMFLAFPNHPLMVRCEGCGRKGALKERKCLHCERPFPPHEDRDPRKMWADVCHPLTPECRAMIEQAVIEAWRRRAAESVGVSHREEIPVEAFGGGTDA